MAKRIEDNELIGKRYGMLVIIGISGKRDKSKHRYMVCQCDCGAVKEVTLYHLRSGASKSCGCQVRQSLIKRCTTHGDSGTRLFNIWQGMRRRCFNKNDSSFIHYGARGITICSEWSDYSVFKKWALSNGYNDSLTIERNDVDGNYCPENCSWIPFNLQARNTRNNRVVCINGKNKLMTDWIKESNVTRTTVYDRIRKGWSVEEALFKPDQRTHRR